MKIQCANPECNDAFLPKTKKQKCCSRKCINRLYYLDIRKTGKYYIYNPLKKRHITNCANPSCKNTFETTGHKKYCSYKCNYLYTHKKLYKKKPHRMKKIVCGKTNNISIKNLFFDLKNNKCENCGETKNLQIHHKEYTMNHKDWSLLCRKCHRKIHPR